MQVIEGDVVYSPSFGGTVAPLSEAEKSYLKTKMDDVVFAIRGAFATAQKKADFAPQSTIVKLAAMLTGFLAPSATRAAVSNTLTALRKTFESTIVDAIPRVMNGEMPAETWFKKTDGYIESVGGILNELKESGIAASLRATFEGMLKDTESFLQRFKKGVENTFDFMPLIVGGAALLAVYLIISRILPQGSAPKQLSGYRRRRLKK
jgi:hypothetical protein